MNRPARPPGEERPSPRPSLPVRCFDWFCRDRRTGQVVIAQWPNLSLWLFGAAAIVAVIARGSRPGLLADVASRAFLVWWATDELVRGVNPWRRCLGGAVLIGLAGRLLFG